MYIFMNKNMYVYIDINIYLIKVSRAFFVGRELNFSNVVSHLSQLALNSLFLGAR